MLHARLRDCAAVPPMQIKGDESESRARRIEHLQKCLGIQPLPPRTDLKRNVVRANHLEACDHEIWSFESRPGLPAIAHVYLPREEAVHPVAVHAVEAFPSQAREPWVQARGVSLALAGIASIFVALPGDFGTMSERSSLGPADDCFLSMSSPFMGFYVWDLIRATDAVDADSRFTGTPRALVGDGVGGSAALFSYAIDSRFRCLALAFNADSYEFVDPATDFWNTVPGIGLLGDVSDIISLREASPILLLGSNKETPTPVNSLQETLDKVKRAFRASKSEHLVRSEVVFGEPDFNRRAREALLAFLAENLKGEPSRPYLPEGRPLTDGRLNPFPSGTLPPEDERLNFSVPADRQLSTFGSEALAEPYPEAISAENRLVSWGRYGRVQMPKIEGRILIADEGIEGLPAEAVTLPIQGIDIPAAVHIGLALPEIYAQILHLSLPGGPEGWESAAMGADALTTMIASVKTLIASSSAPAPIERLEARGEAASLTATFFKLYRPNVEIECSHIFSSWAEIGLSRKKELVVPLARYLRFPG